MGKLCCLAVDPALLEDQPLLANPGVGEALEEHDGESGGKMRGLCTFPSEGHPARPLPSGRAAYGHRLKTRTWQVWSRPTEAPGPLAPPLTSTVHVQSRSSRLGPVHLNTANEGPVCDFETCFPFACLSPLLHPPLLSLPQCSFPEAELQRAPGKSKGSNQFKRQLKIFLCDSPTSKPRARVLQN